MKRFLLLLALVVALLSVIASAFSTDQTAEVLRQIARERAGLAPEPTGPAASAVEQFWRIRASIGDRYEDALAARLGPVRARTLRLEHDGWPRRSVSRGPCQP